MWETGGLTEVKSQTIDQSSGVLMPFYNDANSILFVAGKGGQSTSPSPIRDTRR